VAHEHRRKIGLSLLLVAASIVGCRSKAGEPIGFVVEASLASAPACTTSVTVGAFFIGSYVANGGEPMGSPALVVLTDEQQSVSDRTIAEVKLALPFFAREFTTEDRCVDDGSNDAEIRIACLQLDHGVAAARHLVVRYKAPRWSPPGMSCPRWRDRRTNSKLTESPCPPRACI
jgi:hypothetical protein